MTRIRNIAMPVLLTLFVPGFSGAGEGVDVSFSVRSVSLQDRIAARLPGNTEWSVAAADMNTGKNLLGSENGENGYYLPGSLMKLIITAALLDRDTRSPVDLSATIAVDGSISDNKLHGNIVLKGGGNPLLSTGDLLEAVELIKSIGIREATGGVTVDDTLFKIQEWNSRYQGPAYGVPSALGLDLHTVSIGIEGGRIIVDPPNDAVNVSLNPSGKPGIRQIDDLTYEITGAVQNAAFHSRFSLHDPALYTGGVLLTLLRKQGVVLSGTVKRGILSSQARVVARAGSHDLKSLIRKTNRQSLNASADNMLLLLGALTYGSPGSREKGIRAVQGFLRELGVPLEGLVIDDGSGVSKRNRVSAGQMVDFLRLSAGRPWFDVFYESLSRPGLDGRLREFGYRSDRVRMKSGQLTDAYALAGYVDQPDGRKIAFAYLVNGAVLDAPAVASAGVEVLKELAR